MKVQIEVQCDNEAFDANPTWELYRILKDYAETIRGVGIISEMALADINGNRVGSVIILDE